MIVLAIETSGNLGSIALATPEKIIYESKINNNLTHSQTTMIMIEQAFKISGISLAEVDVLACSSGPGAFTGLRIGAAVAKGICFDTGLRIVPVSSLEALAYNAITYAGSVVPIMDAKRGQAYTAAYKRGVCTIQPTVCEIDEILNIVEADSLFVGDGVLVFESQIIDAGHLIAPPHLLLQSAASIAAVAFKNLEKSVNPQDFELTYIRQSQAERDLKC